MITIQGCPTRYTLDESPMAYKSMDDILAQISFLKATGDKYYLRFLDTEATERFDITFSY